MAEAKPQRVIKLEKKRHSNNVTLFFQDGSSDLLCHADAWKKLADLGVKEPDKVLDWCWNYGKATIKIDIDAPPNEKIPIEILSNLGKKPMSAA
jgi:hypothetical protein